MFAHCLDVEISACFNISKLAKELLNTSQLFDICLLEDKIKQLRESGKVSYCDDAYLY